LGLDRQDIERRDFPIGRRGYEPDAVDAHLRRLADEVEELGRAEPPSAASLAGAASDQVRAIVEAAEATAEDIRRQAEDEAAQIRADAAEEARAHVAKVQEAAEVMLQRVDAVDGELGTLVESLRGGANRLSADLTLLEGNMGELRAVAGGPDERAEPAGRQEAERSAPALEEEADADLADVAAEETPVSEAPAEPATADASGNGDDAEGARLIALNMALNGTPREETERYLAENFQLEDRETLLDEVYARVG
jgi:DivIVA domain-containing protein